MIEYFIISIKFLNDISKILYLMFDIYYHLITNIFLYIFNIKLYYIKNNSPYI